MWRQEIGAYSVRFREQGDEFAHHISVEMGDAGFTSARGSDGTGPLELGPPMSGRVASQVLVHPVDEQRVTCTVTGNGDTPSPTRSSRGGWLL